MFKKRSFIAALLLAFCLLLAYHAWNLIQINETARRAVRARLVPFLPGEFTLERVAVGFGNLKLIQVGFRDPEGRFRLSVRDIKIYLSFRKLFETRFDLVKSVRRIEVRRPSLVFSSGTPRRPTAYGAGPAAPVPDGSQGRPTPASVRGPLDLSRFPIDSLVIKEGSIALEGGPLRDLKFQKINGQIFLAEDRHLLHLSGKFLHPRKNVEIIGFVNRKFEHFNFTVEVNKASLRLLSSAFKGTDFRNGEMDALFSITKAETETSAVQISGNSALRRLSFRTAGGVEGEKISADLAVDNGMVKIEKLSGKIQGLPFSGAGTLDGLADPSFDLSLKLENADLASPGLKKWTDGRLGGKVFAEGRLQGTAAEPRGWVKIRARQVTVGRYALISPSATVEVENRRAEIKIFRGGVMGGTLTAHGAYSFRQKGDTVFSVGFSGNHLDPFSGQPGRGGRSAVDLKGTAAFVRGTLQAAAKVQVRSEALPGLGALSGTVRIAGNAGDLDFQDREANLKVRGAVKNLSGIPSYEISVTSREMDSQRLFGRTLALLPVLHAAEAQISGTGEELTFKGGARVEGKSVAGKIQASGRATRLLKNPQAAVSLEAAHLTVAGIEGPFKCSASLSSEGLTVSGLSFTHSIKGGLTLGKEGALGGEILVKQMNLSAYANQNLDWVKALRPGGILDAQCRFSGTLKAPSASAEGSIINGRLGRVEGLSARVEARWENGSLTVSRASLETPDHRLVTVQNFRLQKPGWTGQVKLDKLPLRDFWAENPPLSGLLYLEASCNAPGNAALRATLDDFAFKNLRLTYLKAEAAESGGNFKIRELSLGNENVSVTGEGFFGLPLSVPILGSWSDTVNLQLLAKGDFLKEVAIHVPAFVGAGKYSTHTQGRGEARLHILGTAKHLYIHRGHLDLSRDKRAVLEVRDIFPEKISQFKGFVHFEDAFASVDLSGRVQGRVLRITNFKSYAKETPLSLPLLGLNFGIVKVVAQAGGIPANFPGIIPPGEFGETELFGPDGKPGILVAGPPESPHLIGSMRVHNARFTYPPVSKKKGPRDNAFLKAVRWDFTIHAGKNLKYFYHHRPESPLPFLDKVTQKNKLAGGLQRGLSQLFEYPFVELTLDKGSVFHLHGGGHAPVKLSGRITSSKGFVHPPLQLYDYNLDLDAGLEFDGNDNIPILWGSAARMDRTGDGASFGDKVTLTLYLKDPKTGIETTKGKFHEFRMQPSTSGFAKTGEAINPYQKMFENEQTVTSIARSEGRAMFEKVFLERMVTGALERKVLGIGRERLNPLLGFNATPDVFRVEIESDRFFDYIDLSVWSLERLRQDFLESMQFVTGKYFLGGRLFFNYSSQMNLIRDAQGLDNYQLHHRLGFELTPWRFLYFNLDYDITSLPQAVGGEFTTDAVRSNVKVKMPLNTIINAFKEKDSTGKVERKP